MPETLICATYLSFQSITPTNAMGLRVRKSLIRPTHPASPTRHVFALKAITEMMASLHAHRLSRTARQEKFSAPLNVATTLVVIVPACQAKAVGYVVTASIRPLSNAHVFALHTSVVAPTWHTMGTRNQIGGDGTASIQGSTDDRVSPGRQQARTPIPR